MFSLPRLPKPKLSFYLFLLISLVAYILLGYYTGRTSVFSVFLLFGTLFTSYGFLYQEATTIGKQRIGLGLGILFRFLLLFSLPNLSDDYYRFIWDGRLLANGISPFAYLPTDIIQQNLGIAGIDPNLYDKLNSPNYFTIYPPICQFIFWLGTYFFPTNLLGVVMVMKSCIFAFECGSIYLIYKLLAHFKLPAKLALLYVLNPLVIIELVGNLHFEGAMIFFLLLFISLLAKAYRVTYNHEKVSKAVIALSMAVCSKLLPLMFLPFFFRRFGKQRSIHYGIIIGITCLVLFLPLFDLHIIQNLFSSIGLYFNSFEFNASIYYLFRWIGYEWIGYNMISIIGAVLGLVTLGGILLLAFREKNLDVKSLVQMMFWSLCLYFALATIVHPWYITTLVVLSLFTPYRFPIVWSGMAILSYYTYKTTAYTESLWFVTIEYIVVYAYFFWEVGQLKYKALKEK